MKPRSNFEAYWLPAFDSNADPDEVISIGFDWLRRAEREEGVRGVLAMHASSMRQNRPILGTAPWTIVSPRSRDAYRTCGPVLAIWPSVRTLELAEHMAAGSRLCVIPYEMTDIAPWIERTGATCLLEGFDAPTRAPLAAEVEEELRHVLSFGGHNGFLGGGEKEVAIRAFHRISRMSEAPSRIALESFLRATGEVDGDGAERAGNWYEEVRAGKRHRDHRGQTIR